MTDYIAVIKKTGAFEYAVSFPDLPGCETTGTSRAEACELAKDALAHYLDNLSLGGEDIPAPSSLETILHERKDEGELVFVSAPGKEHLLVRESIFLRKDLLAEIDAFAVELGMTRSAFLARAAKIEMERSKP